MQNIMDNFQMWLSEYSVRSDIFWLISVLAFSFILHKILKKTATGAIRKIISRLTAKTKSKLDDYIFDEIHVERISLIIYIFAFNFLSVKLSFGAAVMQKLSSIILIWIIIRLLHGLLDGLTAYTENAPQFEGKPYRSYIQVFILIVYIAGFIIAAGTISGKSPLTLLSGIGAMTAVLLLVFRETILSFVASLQISSYDLVRRGDWISVPKYDADGDVTEVALHTIKIQNWDKTISVLPTSDLMQSGFKNWRGMQETGGRRIKRSIFLDVSSVKFMDEELRRRVGKIELLKSYFAEVESSDISAQYGSDTEHPLNDRRLTNIGTFRMYVTRYLQSLDTLRKDLTFLVRQLEPGATGIPLEIYVFTATTVWGEYEKIQADIFDHLFAAVHEFDLRIFQYPVGGFLAKN
ncbi:mechanosensitive ion channel family protein [Treponema sp. OMZ 792]|uniref:mechanosensitive ion channel family protein n=1 Tax=unclassified Treponema TaxID=2638727 RepID=UPI0020A2A602|nr:MULTISPECIES: mechanosensitive ion channel domain-containing protein [unclassified Treponema]UTC75570.1 mechanosensitive ion channel family protein [Treponema sp. OMZ 792]UTC78629.1 mechanosensitive ion channel [Treponema sp. OMZ 799]UTC79572.1 mechanosensitive ion channel [Treponema sp. OMZ 798]